MCLAATAAEPSASSARPPSDRTFLAVSALVFAASVAATIFGSTSMAAMGELPMAGGWTMSMAWTPACGTPWAGAAASFLGMWVAMTGAMMTPSLVPMLARYRLALGRTEPRLDLLTALAATGYALAWTAVGIAVFAVGDRLATLAIEQPNVARAAPFAAGVVVFAAGALQLTAWKARQFAWCRASSCGEAPANAFAALRRGLDLGLRCALCCAGPTAVLLVCGVMDLRAMALATIAISAERLSPGGARIAKATGAMAVAAGLVLIARAAALA